MSHTITFARRHRAERAAWERYADRVAWDVTETERRYLDANPRRADLAEITKVGTHGERFVWCAACEAGTTTTGISTAFVAIAEHNAERHPRRWRAMQQAPGR